MDITEEQFKNRKESILPYTNSAVIGVKFNNLTLVAYGLEKSSGRIGHFYQCDCGNYKFTEKHSQIVKGRFQRCGDCKVLHMNNLRFEAFKTKYNTRFPKYPLENCTYDKWHSNALEATCPDHGVIVTVKKSKLMTEAKTPCRKCNEDTRRSLRTMTKAQFLKKVIPLHPEGAYDYTRTVLKGCTELIRIYCNTCEDTFEQVQDYHIQGGGCNKCSTGGYRTARQGVLYVSIWDGFGKVGITNSTADRRKAKQQKQSGLKGEVVFETPRMGGLFIKELEVYIKSKINLGVVSKAQFPDGFSETFHLKDRNAIIGLVRDYLQTNIN